MSQSIPKIQTLYYFNKSFVKTAAEVIRSLLSSNGIKVGYSINEFPGDIDSKKSQLEVTSVIIELQKKINEIIQSYPWRYIGECGYILQEIRCEELKQPETAPEAKKENDDFKLFLNQLSEGLAEHLFGGKSSKDADKSCKGDKNPTLTFISEENSKVSRVFDKSGIAGLESCYGPKEKPKKPLHPGKILRDILLCQYYSPSKFSLDKEADDFDLTPNFLERFLDGKEDIDHVLAFKIAYQIEGTDVRFWMDLQERYDSYKG